MSDTDGDSSEYTLADSEPDTSELTAPLLMEAGGDLIDTGLDVDIYTIRLPGNRVFAVGTNLAGGTRELSAGTDEVMFIGAYRFTGEVTMDQSEPLGDVNSDTYQTAVAEAIAVNGNPFEVRVVLPTTFVRDILLSEQARGSAIANRIAGNFRPPQWGYHPTATPGLHAGLDSQSGHGHGNAFAHPAYGPHPGGSSATPPVPDQGQTRRSENGFVDPSQWEYGPTESQSAPAAFETQSHYGNGNAFPQPGHGFYPSASSSTRVDIDLWQTDGWENGDGDDDLYADLGFEYYIPGVPAPGYSVNIDWRQWYMYGPASGPQGRTSLRHGSGSNRGSRLRRSQRLHHPRPHHRAGRRSATATGTVPTRVRLAVWFARRVGVESLRNGH